MTNTSPNDKLFYRPAEAAAAVGVSVRTIYNLIAQGQLRPKHIGFCTVIPRDQLLALAK